MTHPGRIGLLICLFAVCSIETKSKNKIKSRFSIDYETNSFVLDGKPFRYVSGSMHYFRVPQEFWEDRMYKMRYGGLNALQTYVYWKGHEPQDGVYDFTGRLDLEAYLMEAKKQGLYVILRLGPYIDAEVDMGGLPFWLLSNNPQMKLRTKDPQYMMYLERWFGVLLPKINKHLISNAGNIIMVQVENEYGSYPACDFEYTSRLRDLIRHHLKDVFLFTTDGAGDDYLKCGKVADTYATVDFGAGGNVKQSFAAQRHFEPQGPLVNSEYYTGWLDLWGEPHSRGEARYIVKTFNEMLDMNASVNFYMYHGGTSFGFMSGGIDSPYRPCPTSYDYDAPLSEAGDMTPKYFLIKEAIEKHFGFSSNLPVPVNSTKKAYGIVQVVPITNIWTALWSSRSAAFAPPELTSRWPMTFEELRQDSGYVVYCNLIKKNFRDPSVLKAVDIRDRGYIYVNQTLVGLLSNSEGVHQTLVRVRKNDRLCILVENQGRVSYGITINQRKGISNVTLGHSKLEDWTIFPMPLNNTKKLFETVKILERETKTNHTRSVENVPGFFVGSFVLEEGEKPADTFLDMTGWSKGVVFINEHNLGRYWPIQGPQVTLYVPSVFLVAHPLRNRIVIFEQEAAPCLLKFICNIRFADNPILDGPVAN